LEFEGGGDAFVVAQIFHTGKCRFFNGRGSEHAETYADLYDQGVRFMVATSRNARTGGCVDDYGRPVRPMDGEFFPTMKPVRNRIKQIITDAMEAIEGWGSFA
jgi:hypothetical protein